MPESLEQGGLASFGPLGTQRLRTPHGNVILGIQCVRHASVPSRFYQTNGQGGRNAYRTAVLKDVTDKRE